MDYSEIAFTILLSMIAMTAVIIFIIFSWGLVWKLLLSRFEFLRAILTDSGENSSKEKRREDIDRRQRGHFRPANKHH